MSFWAAARLEPRRENLALHCLALAGYESYAPHLREHRISRGRQIEVRPPLFPGYAFVAIELGWYTAHKTPGVAGLILDGSKPARVPAEVIAGLKSRERNGLIELPSPELYRPGDSVRILRGPLAGHLALYAGMRPRERVEVLLSVLGGERKVTLAMTDVERA